jgi:hypothetical protein
MMGEERAKRVLGWLLIVGMTLGTLLVLSVAL